MTGLDAYVTYDRQVLNRVQNCLRILCIRSFKSHLLLLYLNQTIHFFYVLGKSVFLAVGLFYVSELLNSTLRIGFRALYSELKVTAVVFLRTSQ